MVLSAWLEQKLELLGSKNSQRTVPQIGDFVICQHLANLGLVTKFRTQSVNLTHIPAKIGLQRYGKLKTPHRLASKAISTSVTELRCLVNVDIRSWESTILHTQALWEIFAFGQTFGIAEYCFLVGILLTIVQPRPQEKLEPTGCNGQEWLDFLF